MSEALVYGVPTGPEPIGGVWIIHKHVPTGELLGPSVPFGVETRACYAELTPEGWREISAQDAEARQRAAW